MDTQLLQIIKDWKIESGMKRVIQYTYRDGILTLYTSQVGYLIGLRGTLVDKYRQILSETMLEFKDVKFVEVSYYWV